jgi:hypothetical protein
MQIITICHTSVSHKQAFIAPVGSRFGVSHRAFTAYSDG